MVRVALASWIRISGHRVKRHNGRTVCEKAAFPSASQERPKAARQLQLALVAPMIAILHLPRIVYLSRIRGANGKLGSMGKRICVFCGSSSGARLCYANAARSLAQYLVENGIGIVYGGGKVGLMGTLADAALEAGGEVIGVMPRHLAEKEISHARLSELRIVDSMHERKALMAELSDAFIAMPGGYGTFEEFCEVLTWTQLGLHRKPCGILNVEGYYDQLLKLFDHAAAEEFVTPAHRKMVIADASPESLVPRLLEYELPVVGKWINVNET
jgi:uncharacterized protein (TIGR00730 family)